MIARRAVWTDSRVRALLERFVPAADEVGFLQRVKSAEGELFRKVAEQGHYAGRTQPTNTRQGLYATTATGQILGALNHNDPARVAAMLEGALAKWEALPAEARAPQGEGAQTPGAAPDEAASRRLEARYPQGGLVLRIFSRDLPRSESTASATARRDWREDAWNMDFAWFRPAEAAACVPPGTKVGTAQDWPAALADRLLRVQLVDNVRGQTYPVKRDTVSLARVTSTVTGTLGDQVLLALTGEVRYEAKGSWRIGGMISESTTQARGLSATLLGSARFDPATGRFLAFEAVVVGMRWGATQYNGRHDDLGPAPIGFLIELAGDTAQERVAPASIWEYQGY